MFFCFVIPGIIIPIFSKTRNEEDKQCNFKHLADDKYCHPNHLEIKILAKNTCASICFLDAEDVSQIPSAESKQLYKFIAQSQLMRNRAKVSS